MGGLPVQNDRPQRPIHGSSRFKDTVKKYYLIYQRFSKLMLLPPFEFAPQPRPRPRELPPATDGEMGPESSDFFCESKRLEGSLNRCGERYERGTLESYPDDLRPFESGEYAQTFSIYGEARKGANGFLQRAADRFDPGLVDLAQKLERQVNIVLCDPANSRDPVSELNGDRTDVCNGCRIDGNSHEGAHDKKRPAEVTPRE